MATGRIELKISNDDPSVGYLSLPDHPGAGTASCIGKQIRLIDILPRYVGPEIILDFDAKDTLVGIEILAD